MIARFLLCLSALALLPQVSFAQSAAESAAGEWMLLPIGGQDQAGALLPLVRGSLAGTPVTALDDDGAALAFEEALSTPPQSVTDTELDAWADHSRDALRYLAGGDYDRAREELLAAQNVSERAAEEMNRSAERARRVLDTCLYMARALIETRQHMEALEQVRTCRVLVPKVEPGGFRHPPEVRAMLERVDGEERHANLEVTSTPSGCLARINGVPQGETPFSMENVARGDYRIQVECSRERGRVHRARVDREDEGTVSIHVDTLFDTAIHSRPFLYGDSGFSLQSVALVASKVGRPVLAMTHADDDPDDLTFWLIEVDPANDAVRVTMVRSKRAGLRRALGALHERRSLDLRGDTPRPITPEVIRLPVAGADVSAVAAAETAVESPEPVVVPRPSRRSVLPVWRLGAGLALLGVGLGTVGLGTYFHFDRADTGDFYATFDDPGMPGYLANRQAWTDSSLAPTASFVLGGGAVAAAGVGLLIPAHEKVQWWAWALGGAGLVLGGASLIPILTRPECISDEIVDDPVLDQDGRLPHQYCIDRDMAASKSVILAGAALPFLAIPISALIQSGRQDDDAVGWLPSLSVSPGGLTLNIAGRLP